MASAQSRTSSGRIFPEAIRDIRVGRKARTLHFLHSAGGRMLLGSYWVHYQSGRTWEIPVSGDVDGLSLRFKDEEIHDVERATLAWVGKNPYTGLRLYKSTWENPFPSDEISSIDVVSAMNWLTLSLFAITVE